MPPWLNGGGNGKQDKYRQSEEIFIDNLPAEVTEYELRELLQPFGRVARVSIPCDWRTNTSRGIAFVSFRERFDAVVARDELDGLRLHHAVLRAQWASERNAGQANPRRGKGGPKQASGGPTKKTASSKPKKVKPRGRAVDEDDRDLLIKDTVNGHQEYAIVTRALGGGTFTLSCLDQITRRGLLRGSMRRGRGRVMVRVGDYVLASLREFGDDGTADIVHRYTSDEVGRLRKCHELPATEMPGGADVDDTLICFTDDESDSADTDNEEASGWWSSTAPSTLTAGSVTSDGPKPGPEPESAKATTDGVTNEDGDGTGWTSDEEDDMLSWSPVDGGTSTITGLCADIINLRGPLGELGSGELKQLTDPEWSNTVSATTAEVRWVPRSGRRGTTVVTGLAADVCAALVTALKAKLACSAAVREAKDGGAELVLAGPHVYVVAEAIPSVSNATVKTFAFGMPGHV
eukprot:m.355665 g.355665  ORF g.355665 m.355665 type:complete len:462 (-) comp16598_c0_seq8:40-1425(-)